MTLVIIPAVFVLIGFCALAKVEYDNCGWEGVFFWPAVFVVCVVCGVAWSGIWIFWGPSNDLARITLALFGPLPALGLLTVVFFRGVSSVAKGALWFFGHGPLLSEWHESQAPHS